MSNKDIKKTGAHAMNCDGGHHQLPPCYTKLLLCDARGHSLMMIPDHKEQKLNCRSILKVLSYKKEPSDWIINKQWMLIFIARGWYQKRLNTWLTIITFSKESFLCHVTNQSLFSQLIITVYFIFAILSLRDTLNQECHLGQPSYNMYAWLWLVKRLGEGKYGGQDEKSWNNPDYLAKIYLL